MRSPDSRARHNQAVFLLLATVVVFAASAALPKRSVIAQIAVQNQGYVPFSDAPINYRSNDLHDPVANLQKRLDRGEATLTFDDQQGYLKSVLQLLNIPVSSQTLVFSKTSFQYKKISPQTPRALYFNDDVYVGFVHDGKALEVVSFDPMQGAIFYLLDAHKANKPLFQRAELDCTQCHIAPATRDVPGVLLRSIFPSATGTQVVKSTSLVTGQDSPLSERWGGWYVTGTSGRQQHMGNVIVQDRDHPELLDRTAGTNISDLSGRFDKSIYLTADSDIVAHMVLAHQTQMHNLITETNYKTRIALYDAQQKLKAGESVSSLGTLSSESRKQIEEPAEALVEYMLFANEVPLTDSIRGTSSFREQFEALGPRDAKGRSLRDFDLHTRIFKYPCSYLIYSESFDALPAPAKQYVYHRLYQILTEQDRSPTFARLTGSDRRNILEILLATKKDLPSEWRQQKRQLVARKADPAQERD
ncbi:hypothetical protein DYQ86_24870 [Acidobacteria bacterium AB60]|nr:hypothetical protein DYQ86_24870 [Acidobacteria bacterium AB60]